MTDTLNKSEVSKLLRRLMNQIEYTFVFSHEYETKKYQTIIRALDRREAIREFIKQNGLQVIIWDIQHSVK